MRKVCCHLPCGLGRHLDSTVLRCILMGIPGGPEVDVGFRGLISSSWQLHLFPFRFLCFLLP